MEIRGFLTLGISFAIAVLGQEKNINKPVCIERVGLFPADRAAFSGPILNLARFELRRCSLDDIQVLMYESGSVTPVVFLDTKDGWPRQIVGAGSVLALQTVGGSGSAVYVFRFLNGKAMKVTALDATENMRVVVNEDGNSVTIDVPASLRTHQPATRLTFPIQ